MGEYLPIDIFGVYNIGFFLASFPMLLGGMVTRKILIPIYRETPPGVSRENFRKMRKMRMLVTAFLLALVALLALIGVWLIGLLYDRRYQMAGAVVVMIAVTQIPQIIVLTYDQAALAAGDSRRFFLLALARAVLMVVCVILGLEMAGLVGGILGQGAAMLLAYPVVVWLSLRSAAWDPLHDALFAGLGAGLAVFSVWFNWPAVSAMIQMSGATG